MKLTDKQLNEVVSTLVSKTIEDLKLANEKGRVEEYLRNHNYESIIKDDCGHCFLKPESRILVIGDIRIGKEQIRKIANEYAIDSEQIDVIDKYKSISNYDFDNLVNSRKYSDIIVAAVPHKTKGTNGSSGIIAHILHNQKKYPNLVVANTGNNIKLTCNTFARALLNTKYYAFLCL